MNKYDKTKSMLGGISNELYDTTVIARAVSRAGMCPNLKGHIHEILFCDNYNMTNIFNGSNAQLTRSVTATMKDVIAKNEAGRVVMHGQLKDTISNSGLRKTAYQIINGHYNKTTVYGTEETTKGVNRILDELNWNGQRVHSSGISSSTTARIANKALGKLPSAAALGSAARAGGIAGAVISGGLEAISSVYQVSTGEKKWDDAIVDIAGATAKGGITGAGSAVAGSFATGAAGYGVSAFTATSIGGAVAGTAGGALLCAGLPIAVGLGAAVAVGSFISDLFE